MNREDALNLVHQYVKNNNLINHMLAVESAMAFYADLLKQDEETWRITGLLHDFDWEIHPSADAHPKEGVPILRKNLVSEEIIHAIMSHSNLTGIARETLMDKALFACDEITGLITAVTLVRPSRSLHDLTSKSVKKKWKDRAFAAGADREEIELAVHEFGVDLWVHVDNVIIAMQRIAPLINLAGNLDGPIPGN
jgi:putative nucleotidyltransferase with HDIG domain